MASGRDGSREGYERAEGSEAEVAGDGVEERGAGTVKGMAWRGEGSRGGAEARRGEEEREEDSEGATLEEGATDGAVASRLGVLEDGAEGMA